MMWKLSAEQFRDRIFDVLDRKQHWSTAHFNGSTVTKEQLNVHFRQEYVVYLRDFAVLLARVVGKIPRGKYVVTWRRRFMKKKPGGFRLANHTRNSSFK